MSLPIYLYMLIGFFYCTQFVYESLGLLLSCLTFKLKKR